ncbi:hypothetical protein CLW00_103278 [Mongoliibacter ruber]|uniref:Uncharacterized protein n=1 Tax=Mongoliibacter ruber TaxID=1750599 RepID=A0A2T0WR33_9BACT|nr:hypothetical protein CLW00_103278 [Mongoliibacter ruber]
MIINLIVFHKIKNGYGRIIYVEKYRRQLQILKRNRLFFSPIPKV